MKKLTIIVLALVLCLSALAGCRSRMDDMTNDTTIASVPDNGNILPDNGNMTPDTGDLTPEDTVDPSSGAEDGIVDPTNGANQNEPTLPENRARRQPMG